eukprot:TRINITY_DN131_c1_g1_i3.p1 TRINITY_DN131_c1_g1~~TRINITY_DN131_c1_g1_i3.p1  ORF type:complete len:831 (+),score=122.22 TRINITY_DN131_c1_g1_i3:133-2625(+)
MASRKPSRVGKHTIGLCLLGVTILYRIVYQIMMYRALVDSENTVSQCGRSPLVNSPECLELHLFRSWKDAEYREHSVSAQPASSGSVTTLDEGTRANVESSSHVESDQSSSIVVPISTNADATKWGSLVSWGKFDKLYNDTLTSIHNKDSVTPWGKSIQVAQEEVESRFEALPSIRRLQHEARQKDFDKLYRGALESISKRSNVTPWGEELAALQEQMERKMRNTPRIHAILASDDHVAEFDRLYRETLASINRSSSTPWADRVKASLAELQFREEALSNTKIRQRKQREANIDRLYFETLASIQNRNSTAKLVGDLADIRRRFERRASTIPHVKHASLLERINDLGRELCESPKRRHRVTCAQFLSNPPSALSVLPDLGTELTEQNAALDSSLSDGRREHDRWLLNFSKTIDSYTKDLCSDPRRKNYKACEIFLRTSPENVSERGGRGIDDAVGPTRKRSESEQRALRGAVDRVSDRISWSTVVASSELEDQGKQNSGVVLLTRDDLRAVEWLGKKPKVACITAVPVGQDSHIRLDNFLQEFRAQTYDGPRQLILVYSPTDKETADVVRASADGDYIRAVAAHDGLDPLSTAALRYAAWTSNADVVASWRFDEKHHIDRLAMQVRALGLAGRPASILSRWTVLFENRGEQFEEVLSADPGWEGSLVGEKAWMQKHWMPVIDNERKMFHGFWSGKLVQVDIPELSVYTTKGLHAAADAGNHFNIASLLGASACSGVDNEAMSTQNAIDLLTATNDAAGVEAGRRLGDVYLLHHGVVGRLQSLCASARKEEDPHKRMGLLRDAGIAAKNSQELAGHFRSVKAILARAVSTV